MLIHFCIFVEVASQNIFTRAADDRLSQLFFINSIILVLQIEFNQVFWKIKQNTKTAGNWLANPSAVLVYQLVVILSASFEVRHTANQKQRAAGKKDRIIVDQIADS